MNEMKTTKEIERSLVQSENRLAYVQDEIKRATKTRDALNEEIERKSSDYQIFMAQRDGESKKIRADILAEREQLDKDKGEFQVILQQFSKDKAAFLEMKKTNDAQAARYEGNMNNIRQFVIAVQRATSLLGL